VCESLEPRPAAAGIADGNEIAGYWTGDGQRGGNVGWTRDK
jgi:hypothetical protein